MSCNSENYISCSQINYSILNTLEMNNKVRIFTSEQTVLYISGVYCWNWKKSKHYVTIRGILMAYLKYAKIMCLSYEQLTVHIGSILLWNNKAIKRKTCTAKERSMPYKVGPKVFSFTLNSFPTTLKINIGKKNCRVYHQESGLRLEKFSSNVTNIGWITVKVSNGSQ